MTPELLAAAEPRMDEVAARRARHVVEEDLRVHETELALAAGDLDEVGRLFAASHASLRDLYEVSSPGARRARRDRDGRSRASSRPA